MKRHTIKFQMNAPCILWLTFISFAILLASQLTGGLVNNTLMLYKTSWTDPMQYVRLFTHVLCHSSWEHFLGNYMMILVVGPLVEEKYGSSKLLFMIGVTALVTGLISVIFFPRVAILGTSGVLFMLILLGSFVNIKSGFIPITVILVAVIYIGREVLAGFTKDNISQLAHIIGGLCGTGFGILIHRRR